MLQRWKETWGGGVSNFAANHILSLTHNVHMHDASLSISPDDFHRDY